ncbi:hypothetical protein LWI29_026240 [Acer saccharum]|uniref:C2H2-type domain-containing protein n=1 Tax=Acer saccharum TaxID=4024 RepID=A0AA39SAC7_ACESA|nr:hypothetical protein LWI29_026240 [Acer saccharum]
MSTSMEFWGVEVKSGQPLKINPGDNKIVHLSQASLGEVKKGSEPVCLYIKVNDKKLVLGTLSAEKFPQLSFDLVVEKEFELSHNWKIGSIYFTGYKIHVDEGTDAEEDDTPEYAVEVPLTNNGKDESRANSVSEKNASKPDSSAAKQKVKNVKPNQQAEDSDSDDGDLEGSSTDDDENSDEETPKLVVNRMDESDESSGEEDESDEDDDEDTDESESDDEEEKTPSKAELRNKRPAESATKTPVPDKKAKFITPQKTEGKKGISHTATPYPSKQAGKTPANSDQAKQQAKKSGGSYSCKSCNRSFTTDGGLQAHTKAKHTAAA